MKSELSRRRFLHLGTGIAVSSGLISTLGGFGRALAATSDTSGYKALVCLLLNGGNNGHNWLVPVSDGVHSVYASARAGLALSKTSLLPLNGAVSNGNTYGLHPSCPELQGLFNSGKAAFICNAGTLIQPTTKAQAQSGSAPLPPQLFAHLDQQTEWLTGVPQSPSRYGWGGRLADLFVSQGLNVNLATNISVGGANYWQEGQITAPFTLGTGSAATLSASDGTGYRNGARARATLDLISQGAADSNLMVKEYSGILTSSSRKVAYINQALSAAGDLNTQFPGPSPNDSGLSQQLHQVARVIKARSQIADGRQMFFVQIGGFDTHNDELNTQAALLRFVSQYVQAFWNAMVEINMQNNVTLFTVSDFGRTLTSNGDGADHGWGSHHLVVGGAVKGGQLYGTMPDLTLDGPNDFGLGRLIPTTSADQHAATLARWFGAADSDLDSIFTNLKNFSVRNLGFMG
jgi:uncharacterized protein (DUF1501 family)